MNTSSYLINPVNVGSERYYPGQLISDALVLARVAAAGGALWPASDPIVAAAAEHAGRARKRGDDAGAAVFMSTGAQQALGSFANGGILWSPRGKGNAETFDDVRRLLDRSTSPQLITLDHTVASYVADAQKGVVDLHGSWFAVPIGGTTLSIADGTQLRNMGGGAFGGASGIGIEGNSTGLRPALDWDAGTPGSPLALLGSLYGGGFRNDGTAPMIVVPDGAFFVMSFAFGGGVQDGAHGAPVVSLGAGSVCLMAEAFNVGLPNATTWLAGPASSTLGVENSGFDFDLIATWTSFLGTTLNIPIGSGGASGPTAFRPVPVFGPLTAGTWYFDKSLAAGLGKPVYWTLAGGGQFVDATGTPS